MTTTKRKTSIEFFKKAQETENAVIEDREALGKKEEVSQPVPEIEETEKLIEEETQPVKATNQGFREYKDFFNKIVINNPRQTEIDEEHRNKLKIISTAEKCPINSLIYNIIDEFLKVHSKDVKKSAQKALKYF